jgi:hypothetical protein
LRRAAIGLFLTTLLVLAPACGGGGGGSGSSATANIRFVQGSIDAPSVDFLVNGTTQESDMLYGNASSYVSVKAGNSQVQVIPVDSSKPLLDQTFSLADSGNETVILTGPVAQLKPLVLDDGATTTGATTGVASVRVVSVSSHLGPADVYIIPSGGSLSGSTPVSSGLDFDQDTGYQPVNVGTGSGANYTVYMTVPGTQSVYISTGPLTFTPAKKQTVIILDGLAGGFTFTQLTDQ